MSIKVSFDIFKLAQVFTISRGSRTEAEVLTVKITKNGVTGWGECVPYARYNETLQSVEKQINDLSAEVDRTSLLDELPAGAARNAVDCALWDLESKLKNKRVWQLLGLKNPEPQITAFTLSLGSPENMFKQASEIAYRHLL